MRFPLNCNSAEAAKAISRVSVLQQTRRQRRNSCCELSWKHVSMRLYPCLPSLATLLWAQPTKQHRRRQLLSTRPIVKGAYLGCAFSIIVTCSFQQRPLSIIASKLSLQGCLLLKCLLVLLGTRLAPSVSCGAVALHAASAPLGKSLLMNLAGTCTCLRFCHQASYCRDMQGLVVLPAKAQELVVSRHVHTSGCAAGL